MIHIFNVIITWSEMNLSKDKISVVIISINMKLYLSSFMVIYIFCLNFTAECSIGHTSTL